VSTPPRLAAPVAIVVSRFPTVTETFILRELVELDRRGVPVLLVPLLRGTGASVHDAARAWTERALYSPFVSLPILRENLRALIGSPRRYVSTLARSLWEARSSRNALLGVLGVFPKAAWAGWRARQAGVRHVHAHFATHPALAALVMSRVHDGSDADLPFSVTAHAHDIFVTHAGLRQKLGAASFVRCISEFNGRYLRKLLAEGEDSRQRYPVIHCGVVPEAYAPAPAAGPLADRPARILCIASMRPYKGLTHLVEAIRLLREQGLAVACDVIGDGPLREELERQARAAGQADALRMPGTRTEDEVAAALASADLLVLPSVVASDGQMEGIPVALMEALAAGVPVVATRLSGIPELIVDDVTGTLVEPGDARALAEAMRRVLQDPVGNRRRAEAGRTLVREQFEIGGVVSRLLEQLLRHGASSGGPPAIDDLARRASALVRAGSPPDVVGIVRSQEGADAQAAMLLLPDDGRDAMRRVVAKRHLDHARASSTARERAENEHRALRALSAERELAGSVPAPRALDALAAIVVMEAVEGRRLDGALREARWRPWRLGPELAALRAAGAWLAALSRAGGPARDEDAFRAQAILERLLREVREDASECLARGLSPRSVERLRAACEQHLPQLVTSSRSCWTHGDFWPGNVLFGIPGRAEGSVVVLDLEGLRPGIITEDSATFHEHLALALSPSRSRFASEFAEGVGAPTPLLMRAAKALRLVARAPSLAAAGATRRLAALARCELRLHRLAGMYESGLPPLLDIDGNTT
jgi:glycosyltransferase involved in cell wall biosynthesis/aminoglycoside phosphotransferase (APT) family kinase protein